ncbi:MAG TPA: hypothetical protein PLY88_08605 [Candidatus Omnitrophota bacterium]|nr:hypothetical protein [Candidatus Omnitrophota bacterium]HRK62585.1 hypothetical protein [Candidatus Omnitrophota bacterium]
MKKVIALALVMMMVGASPGFSMLETADRILVKDRVASDFRPEHDLGRLIGFTKDSLFKGFDMLMKPIAPVSDPVRKVTGEVIKAPIKVVNATYDLVTKPIPGYKR